MINSVSVINHLGEMMEMNLRNPEESGFLISSMDGLGPGQAEISTTDLAAADGAVYNSSRLVSRNIVINLIFVAKPTIEDSRQRSYKFFPLKKNITLLFQTDNRLVQIEGYVESNDPDIFSDQEGTSISIICPNPYFYSISTKTTVFNGIEPMFEFPFSNESLTEPLLIMSELRTKYENVVYYEGDAETGFVMKIHFVGPASGISIYNVKSREIMKIDTTKLAAIVGSSIQASDDLIISTVTGKKSLTFIREGKTYNVLNALDRDSSWLKLAIGENVLAFTADEGNYNLQFEVYNDILFEGI